MLCEQEKSTPFDFDMELVMLEYNLGQIFGVDFVNQQDVQDMFHDFRANQADFAQLWDSINYNIEQNIDDMDYVFIDF